MLSLTNCLEAKGGSKMEFLNLIKWKLFNTCVRGDSFTPIMNKILKLMEETGELSSIWLAYIDSNNKSKSATKQLENGKDVIMEEALDVLLVTLDLIANLKNKLDLTDEQIAEIFNKKVEKWDKKLHSKEE